MLHERQAYYIVFDKRAPPDLFIYLVMFCICCNDILHFEVCFKYVLGSLYVNVVASQGLPLLSHMLVTCSIEQSSVSCVR